MKETSARKALLDGLFTNNPTFIQMLGMCPTLAITTAITNALGMGLATTAGLVCSNALISMLRRIIPKEIRIAAYIVMISGFVTAVELLMKAYVRGLYETLGIYIPLIVVNCIILARAESFASKNKMLPSIMDGIGCGLGFTGAIMILWYVCTGDQPRTGADFRLQCRRIFHPRFLAGADSMAARQTETIPHTTTNRKRSK